MNLSGILKRAISSIYNALISFTQLLFENLYHVYLTGLQVWSDQQLLVECRLVGGIYY